MKYSHFQDEIYGEEKEPWYWTLSTVLSVLVVAWFAVEAIWFFY